MQGHSTTEQKVQHLAALIRQDTVKKFAHDYPDSAIGFWDRECEVTVTYGKRYIRVDVGRSGKYMVDETGAIFGIKAYGVIHRGYRYGTLDTVDDWYWGGYRAHQKDTCKIIRLAKRDGRVVGYTKETVR